MTVVFTVNPPKLNEDDLKPLFENLELIFQYRDLILKTPEYYNLYISGVGIYPLYIKPLKLFLGDLIQLWEKTDWRQGDEYIYFVTGSPLSGSNCCRFYQKDQGFKSKHNPTMSALLSPAYMLVQTGSPDRFGNCVPVNPPHRTPSNLSIVNLINILNEKH